MNSYRRCAVGLMEQQQNTPPPITPGADSKSPNTQNPNGFTVLEDGVNYKLWHSDCLMQTVLLPVSPLRLQTGLGPRNIHLTPLSIVCRTRPVRNRHENTSTEGLPRVVRCLQRHQSEHTLSVPRMRGPSIHQIWNWPALFAAAGNTEVRNHICVVRIETGLHWLTINFPARFESGLH